MCGIVAVVSSAGPIDAPALERALRALDHRGPDGSGTWISADRRVGIAHARLSIIDHETGAQPITGGTGEVHAAVNGELYGFERMRAELERLGHRFSTRSDSEVLVHLFEAHGLAMFPHLCGELAFVLWDARSRRLIAGRDRFGAKPLVYTWIDGALWIASEAKALFAAGAPRRWDHSSVAQAMALQYVAPDRTLFDGIKQVPPGCVLELSGALTVSRYWDHDHPPAEALVEDAPVERVRELLFAAVQDRLRAEVPVCFQLSGGIDSTAVVGIARALGAPLACFTIAFDGETHDESPIARASAAAFGAELHVVRADERAMLDVLPDAVWSGEGLAINAHLPAKYLLLRAVRAAGFEVVLSGEGSDEVFAGYPHFRRDLLLASGADAAAFAALEAANAATAGVFSARGATLPLGGLREVLGVVPSFVEAKAGFGARMGAVYDGPLDAGVLLDGVDGGQLRGRHPVHRAMVLWSKLALSNYILRVLGDGMEMAHGVEGRLPYLDHRLFEVVRSVSPSVLIAGGVEKHVLREAVRGLVPDVVRARRKHPLIAPPLGAFAAAGAHPVVDAVFREGTLASFFDRARVRSLVESLAGMDPAERIATEPVLMTVLTASLLGARFGLS